MLIKAHINAFSEKKFTSAHCFDSDFFFSINEINAPMNYPYFALSFKPLTACADVMQTDLARTTLAYLHVFQ